MSSLETLIAKARSWQSQDPDAETKAELEALILAGDEQGLAHDSVRGWALELQVFAESLAPAQTE
jgi:hypothetical protein